MRNIIIGSVCGLVIGVTIGIFVGKSFAPRFTPYPGSRFLYFDEKTAAVCDPTSVPNASVPNASVPNASVPNAFSQFDPKLATPSSSANPFNQFDSKGGVGNSLIPYCRDLK